MSFKKTIVDDFIVFTPGEDHRWLDSIMLDIKRPDKMTLQVYFRDKKGASEQDKKIIDKKINQLRGYRILMTRDFGSEKPFLAEALDNLEWMEATSTIEPVIEFPVNFAVNPASPSTITFGAALSASQIPDDIRKALMQELHDRGHNCV